MRTDRPFVQDSALGNTSNGSRWILTVVVPRNVTLTQYGCLPLENLAILPAYHGFQLNHGEQERQAHILSFCIFQPVEASSTRAQMLLLR